MAASFATAPAAWAITSSGNPSDNISAAPAGSNRKLVVTLCCEDADAWTISTMQVGGQSPDVTHTGVDTTEGSAECRIRSFEWFEATIASMSGVAITFADTAFINPMAITHYWLQDVDQSSGVQTSGIRAISEGLSTIEVTGCTSSVGDMAVAVGCTADDVYDINDWDVLDTALVEDTSNTNFYVGLGYAADVGMSSTTLTFDCTPTGNIRGAVEVLVHAQAAPAVDSVSITSVGPLSVPIVYDNEQRVTITGENFGASQGTGAVKLHDTDPLTTTPGTTVSQTVKSWSDTAIVFEVDLGALSAGQVWLGVEDDGAASEDSLEITVKADPGASAVGARQDPVPDRVISVGASFSFDASKIAFASDAQDRLTYTATGLPTGLAIDLDTGIISGTIDGDATASSPFATQVTATDLDGNTAVDSITWTVTAASSVASVSGSRNERNRGCFLARLFRR